MHYRLAHVRVALSHFVGAPVVRAYLQADSNGLPGGILDQLPIDGLRATAQVLTGTSMRRPLLRSGTAYWLTIVAGGAGVVAGWNWNSIGDVASTNMAVTQGGSPSGPWSLVPLIRCAFQIEGTRIERES
jgi:hypothetical protein